MELPQHALCIILYLGNACNLIDSFQARGCRKTVLVAVDSSAFENILEAFQEARRLGYRLNSSEKRRRLENHKGEYLVPGGYYADSYKRLAVIPIKDISSLTPLDLALDLIACTGSLHWNQLNNLLRAMGCDPRLSLRLGAHHDVQDVRLCCREPDMSGQPFFATATTRCYEILWQPDTGLRFVDAETGSVLQTC